MTALTAALLVAFLLMVFAPQSTMGETLHRALVEPLARLLNKGPLKVLLAVLVVFAAVGVALSMPELFVLMGMTDATLSLEAVLLSTAAGAVAASTDRAARPRRRLDRAADGRVGPGPNDLRG